MAEKEKALEMRPVPHDLNVLMGVLSVFAVMNTMSGTFVQVMFSADYGIACAVAIVGNAIAPLGLKLLKRLSSSLSPKLSMLASTGGMLLGLSVALFVESLLVMIWGFTTTTAAATCSMQYMQDLFAMHKASEAEKVRWSESRLLFPAMAALAGFLLGPCFYDGIWQSQACGLIVMLLMLPFLLQLPSPASTFESAPTSWSFKDLNSRNVWLCLSCVLLQASRNFCRETMLGPTITNRSLGLAFGYPLDIWSWAQLNFLATFGGLVGTVSATAMGSQPANSFFIVVLVFLCWPIFVMEIQCESFRSLMMSTFCAATLRHLSTPLLWKLFDDVISSEEMSTLKQAASFFDILLGFVVPVVSAILGFQGSGTIFLSVICCLLLLLLVTLPKKKVD